MLVVYVPNYKITELITAWYAYPCPTSTIEEGYKANSAWMSEKLPSRDQKEMTFRFNLDGI